MDQDLPAQPRALIVDDEYLFALSLAADMQALGFDICDIAANRSRRLFAGNGGRARYRPDGR